MLSLVVAQERPDVEEAKSQLVVSGAQMKRELRDIEDEILQRLGSAEGDPADSEELLLTLEASKAKAAEIQVKHF